MYVLLFIADPNDPHPTPYMSDDDAPGFLSVHPSGYQKGHSSQIHYDYFHHWGAVTCHYPQTSSPVTIAAASHVWLAVFVLPITP